MKTGHSSLAAGYQCKSKQLTVISAGPSPTEPETTEHQARDVLLQALVEEGLLRNGMDPISINVPWTRSLADAIHAHLARSRSVLFMAQLDDLTNEERQVSMPGSVTDAPNWQIRLSRSLGEITRDAAIAQTLAEITRERETPTATA